jgi:nucleotide-binding universal stress UspA family protein
MERTVYDRILVTLDGSGLAEQALPVAETLAERCGATLLLLCVTALPAELIEALDAERREADRYLAGLYARLAAKGLQVHYQRQEGAPAALITEQARHQAADLIVLTRRGRSRAPERAVGSVAEAVLHTAPCSVLVV